MSNAKITMATSKRLGSPDGGGREEAQQQNNISSQTWVSSSPLPEEYLSLPWVLMLQFVS